MVIGESIRTSLEEVRAHPLRSFFTLIGVILGSLALVVVLSVIPLALEFVKARREPPRDRPAIREVG